MTLSTEQLIYVVGFLVTVAGGLVAAVRYLYKVQIDELHRRIDELMSRLDSAHGRIDNLEHALQVERVETVSLGALLIRGAALLTEVLHRERNIDPELSQRLAVYLRDATKAERQIA